MVTITIAWWVLPSLFNSKQLGTFPNSLNRGEFCPILSLLEVCKAGKHVSKITTVCLKYKKNISECMYKYKKRRVSPLPTVLQSACPNGAAQGCKSLNKPCVVDWFDSNMWSIDHRELNFTRKQLFEKSDVKAKGYKGLCWSGNFPQIHRWGSMHVYFPAVQVQSHRKY